MEVFVDFSSFLDVEMKVGNKVEIKSDDCTFKAEMEKDFANEQICKYLSLADIDTVKEIMKYAAKIVKEDEEEEKKDENIIEEIVSQELQRN